MGPVQESVVAEKDASRNAVERVGTGAGTEEDTEGLLKGLFGRSYKPMDDGALALINLGAGIAKGDITGGMQSAVTAIGEERDRDRKDMLAKAQADFYASGGRGAKDTAMDVDALRSQIVAMERTPLTSMGGGSGAAIDRVDEVNSITNMAGRLFQ